MMLLIVIFCPCRASSHISTIPEEYLNIPHNTKEELYRDPEFRRDDSLAFFHDWFVSISCNRNVTKKKDKICRCNGKLTYADTKSVDYVSVHKKAWL